MFLFSTLFRRMRRSFFFPALPDSSYYMEMDSAGPRTRFLKKDLIDPPLPTIMYTDGLSPFFGNAKKGVML